MRADDLLGFLVAHPRRADAILFVEHGEEGAVVYLELSGDKKEVCRIPAPVHARVIRRLRDRTKQGRLAVDVGPKALTCFVLDVPLADGRTRMELSLRGSAQPEIARNAELESAIAEDPDDREAYLVYADWLQAHGDPRGELIMMQDRAADTRTSRTAELLLEEHTAYLAGGLEGIRLRWRWGFIRSARVAISEQQDWALRVKPLVDHPSARFLRQLEVRVVNAVRANDDGLSHLRHPLLPELTLDQWHRGPVLKDPARLAELLPGLERLTLKMDILEWGPSRFERLEDLLLAPPEMTPRILRDLPHVELPQLATLRVRLSRTRLGDDNLAQLLRRCELPSLTTLKVRDAYQPEKLEAQCRRARPELEVHVS